MEPLVWFHGPERQSPGKYAMLINLRTSIDDSTIVELSLTGRSQ